MKHRPDRPRACGKASPTGLAALVAATVLLPWSADAFPFTFGEVSGSLDTTLSLGASQRLGEPDRRFYGTASGGLQNSVNADDGNLNYPKGLASLAAKGTSDLQLDLSRNFKAFARATYFYDHENERRDRDRTPLSRAALREVGKDFELLDAFVVGRFTLADRPLDVRLGSQVLSWGESTFIQNGINVINPVDVSSLRVPGAELKDALRPVPMLSVSFGVSENVNFEAFYQFAWEETVIDPAGTYFSTNDFAGLGGSRVYLGFGAIPDDSPLGFVPRGPDGDPSDAGQFGLAARILAPGLDSTEFGFFFVNYHSRLPLISARTPTTPIDAAAVQADATRLAQQNIVPAMLAAGIPPASISASLTTLLGAAFTNVPVANLPASLQPFYPGTQSIVSGASRLGLLTAAATGRYLVEYPEDIRLYGMSFNTDLGGSGISLQGELSYKTGVPLQRDDVELLFAALSALNPVFGANNQIGNFLGQLDRRISGWSRKDVWQAQATATRLFGPVLGASQALVLGEVGFTRVNGLPRPGVLRFDGSGTFTGGDQAFMNATGNGAFPAAPESAFADDFSWGYQLAARLDYNNAFAGVNVAPSLAFAHDVSGNTPLPLGNFLEGRRTLTLGVELSYLNQYALELRYVNYSGGGVYNLIADRDFASLTFKYSF